MENVTEGLPQTQPEFRGGISQSFMDALNPERETETPVEAVPEAQPVAEEAPVEAVETPVEEDVIEVGETPEPTPEPQLEVVEEVEEPATVAQPEPVKPTYEIEGINKLVEFMTETGGTIDDYVKLNKDYSDYNDKQLLTEFYKQTKPHLESDDIKYLVDNKLDIDEDLLEEGDLRAKKIALKEELFQARQTLVSNKEKYFEEIKAQPRAEGPSEADLALQKQQEANHQFFLDETNKHFEGFKGFDFNLKIGDAEQTVRYKVDNAESLKDYQSDLNNVLGEFVDESGKIKDVARYHKAVFAMKNVDKIAQLFIDQGYAMAIKEQAKNSKNTDFSPQHHEPSSNTKLAPGQAREIAHPNQSNTYSPKIRRGFMDSFKK